MLSFGVAPKIDRAQHGNVTLISDTALHHPFVGSGRVVQDPSFAIPLVRIDLAADVADASRTASLLYERLRPGSKFLDPTTPLPYHRVDADLVAQVSRQDRGAARRFQVVRVQSLGGEVETSLFTYVAVPGGNAVLRADGHDAASDRVALPRDRHL